MDRAGTMTIRHASDRTWDAPGQPHPRANRSNDERRRGKSTSGRSRTPRQSRTPARGRFPRPASKATPGGVLSTTTSAMAGCEPGGSNPA